MAMVGIPNTKGFIVDGFPRELEQGQEFENEVSTLCKIKDTSDVRAPGESSRIVLAKLMTT